MRAAGFVIRRSLARIPATPAGDSQAGPWAAPSAAAFSGAANAKAESDRSAGKRRNEPWVVPQNRPNIQLDAADKALDDAASASSQEVSSVGVMHAWRYTQRRTAQGPDR